ncbi:hypothetical protein, partial [Pseudomonas sp. PS01303]|uniref:hypothetical protein n=1 Tax=Pseudomonas sp. PS01303 TaxID=2991439 RepID=UPI00249C1561
MFELHRPEISSRTLVLNSTQISSLSPRPLGGEGWGEGEKISATKKPAEVHTMAGFLFFVGVSLLAIAVCHLTMMLLTQR